MRSLKDTIATLVALALVAAALYFFFGHSQKTETQQPVLTVANWLYACSPFESFDKVRLLECEINHHSLKASEAIGEEKTGGAIMAHQSKVIRGSWSADDVTKEVVVELEGAKNIYMFVTPGSGDACILSAGPVTATDLSRSWFGIADFSDNGPGL